MASGSVSLIWFHSCRDRVIGVAGSSRVVGGVGGVCRGMLNS